YNYCYFFPPSVCHLMRQCRRRRRRSNLDPIDTGLSTSDLRAKLLQKLPLSFVRDSVNHSRSQASKHQTMQSFFSPMSFTPVPRTPNRDSQMSEATNDNNVPFNMSSRQAFLNAKYSGSEPTLANSTTSLASRGVGRYITRGDAEFSGRSTDSIPLPTPTT